VLAASSLRGAVPDGLVALDGAGRLVVDRALRRRFDWYLALAGESDHAGLRALFARDVEAAHGVATAAEALAWFDRYVDCLRAESALPPVAGAADRLAALHAVRERVLGPAVAAAFYGDEEREAVEVLARLDAGRDAPLPRGEAAAAARVAAHDERLARSAADAATRHAQRSTHWGPEAADRLAALDLERAQWRGRIEAYRRDAQMIHADRSLDDASRNRALVALRAARFDPQERARIEALEAVGRLDASTYP